MPGATNDAAALRELIAKATQEELADGGRYFAGTCDDLTRCRHEEIGEYQHSADGRLIEWLWNKRHVIADVFAAAPASDTGERAAFQERVRPWLLACFGEMIAGDREERNHRFLEEALELVQACGCTANEAHQLVDYVFTRGVGEPPQEVGGVMVTLAALCLANGLDMHANAETELSRIWTKVETIRAKQAAKPKHSPLPQHVAVASPAGEVGAVYIRFSADGQHIQKWSRQPFEGAHAFAAAPAGERA